MKNQNLNLICILFAMASVGTTGAFADSVELTAGAPYAGYTGGSFDPYQNADGGEFGVLSVASNGALQSDTPSSYSTKALYTFGANDNSLGAEAGLTGFETFCVEGGDNDIYFTPGQVYNVTTSESVIGGPLGTISLSAGAAWLYSQFASGNLANYDYSTDAAHANDAGELQDAIWFLQGEIGNPNNTYSNAALSYFGNNLTLAQESVSDYSTNFGVEVMNLTDANGNSAQNQLYYVGGVPDGGMTVGLLGIALLALAFVKRQRSRIA